MQALIVSEHHVLPTHVRLGVNTSDSSTELHTELRSGIDTSSLLLHDPQAVRDLERCLRLRLDLVHRHALRVLDERQAVREVDLEHSLQPR